MGPTGNYLNETVVPMMAKPHVDSASDSVVHFGGDQAAYDRAKGVLGRQQRDEPGPHTCKS